MDNFAAARTKMVDSQLRTESVTDHRVLAAMSEVAREMFVPPDQKALAYVDRDVPLKDGGRALMDAAPLARMIQAADIDAGDKVLIVGIGTGYSAAVVARLAASVAALESDAALAAQAVRNLAEQGATNAIVTVGPLEAGYAAGAPYDVVLFDGAIGILPEAIFAQLAEGGRLVAVMGYGRAATATLYAKSEGQVGQRPLFDADVPPLPGFRKPEVFVF